MIRNFHSVGASMFFLAVYIHMFRGFYYGSYKAPREVLWILGVVILLVMMATAFMGYTLPWGQMSFWGVTVITNLFSALDTIYNGLGTAIVEWLWGGYSVSGVTLNRFYSLHYLLPFVLTGVVVLHIWALHTVGQNNPTGLEIRQPSDAVPMHPYATSKDAVGLFAFLILFAWFVFFVPDYLGHADNYVEANPLVTPPHIVPEWYFLPFYAILRAFTSSFLGIPLGQYAKLCGVVAMFSAVLITAFAPWLDTSRVRSAKYRPIFKWFFWFFAFTCVALGYLGSKPAEGVYVTWAQIFTVCYFLFFLVVMPIVGLIETPKETAALDHGGGARQRRGGATVRRDCCAASALRGERSMMKRFAQALGASLAAMLISGAALAAEAGSPGNRTSAVGVFRLYRPVRQGSAAARLPGLQRSLLELSWAGSAFVSQPRAARRTGVSRGSREAARRRVAEQDHRRPERRRQDVRASAAVVGPHPRSLSQRQRSPRRSERRPAAGPVADCKGSRCRTQSELVDSPVPDARRHPQELSGRRRRLYSMRC